MCTIRKSYEDKGVQLFNIKVLRSRSLRERPTKVPNVNSLVHKRTRWGSGRAAANWLENFQGKLCFQGKRKLLKNPEWYKIFQYSEKF